MIIVPALQQVIQVSLFKAAGVDDFGAVKYLEPYSEPALVIAKEFVEHKLERPDEPRGVRPAVSI